uniref:Uncharacterized protein n=2 Tax=viral metagenome TaxID=1070528 RepID=A0A6M3K999_9ZZZZ
MEHDGAGCGGIITTNTSDDDMRARGFSEAAIREVRDFQAFLVARGNLEFHGSFQEWRARWRAAPTEETKP